MLTISDLKKLNKKIDLLDIDLIISAVIQRPREFVLAHPEFSINNSQRTKINNLIKRRLNGEPIAYILGQKEFFGLNFAVNRRTLIPRPETELLVEKVLKLKPKDKNLVDIGTGSGNIIISLAKNIKDKNNYIAIDISKEALKIAKHNAKKNKVDKKIKFLHGNLLEPIIKNKISLIHHSSFIILANLPYLSREIYKSASNDIKKYEPKSALYSKKNGLDHYERLLGQIVLLKKRCCILDVVCYMEISPEQKNNLHRLIKKYFPKIKPVFHKDLAGRWRICEIDIY